MMCMTEACHSPFWTENSDLSLYTVSHKKRATLFLIITPAFVARFLYFLYQWEHEGLLYKVVNKIYHFTLTVSPHYLVKPKRLINSSFKSIITVHTIEAVVCNICRKSSNVCLLQFLVENSFISLL